MNADPATHAGNLLLMFAAHDARTEEDLVDNAGLSATAVARQLHRLTDFGFIVVDDPEFARPTLYRLNPKGVRAGVNSPARILLVEDAETIRRLVAVVLEDEGYAVIAVEFPVHAVELLNVIDFDLVITDSFGAASDRSYAGTADLLKAAGTTPAALFSAYRVQISDVQAAGFRDVISKPFDIDVLAAQVSALLDRKLEPELD